MKRSTALRDKFRLRFHCRLSSVPRSEAFAPKTPCDMLRACVTGTINRKSVSNVSLLSYSRDDTPFVDRLSIALLENNFKVWRDEWKLKGGDSLTEKIGGAIAEAGFLCVVLSNHALASQWVEREIELGLLTRAEANRLTILPLVIDEMKDGNIPAQLKDLLFIDFRGDFDKGFQKLLNVLIQGRELEGAHGAYGAYAGDYFVFFSSEAGRLDERPFVDFEIVSVDRQEKYCVLTEIHCLGNEKATEQYFHQHDADSMKIWILRTCAREFAGSPGRTEIRSGDAKFGKFDLVNDDQKMHVEVKTRIKVIGEFGYAVQVFNFGALFAQMCEALQIEWDQPQSEEHAE